MHGALRTYKIEEMVSLRFYPRLAGKRQVELNDYAREPLVVSGPRIALSQILNSGIDILPRLKPWDSLYCCGST